MKTLASFFSITYLAAAFAFGNELTIQREYSSPACVSGYLLINGEATCYVLERPWQNNAAVISSIPAGKYSAFIREDGAKGWRIELFDVPGREHIQIHIGNTVADSVGCLLPGRSISANLCEVYKSAARNPDVRIGDKAGGWIAVTRIRTCV